MRFVSVGGFWFSGSSAVKDYLRSFRGVCAFPTKAEFKFVSSSFGFYELRKSLAGLCLEERHQRIDEWAKLMLQEEAIGEILGDDQLSALDRSALQLIGAYLGSRELAGSWRNAVMSARIELTRIVGNNESFSSEMLWRTCATQFLKRLTQHDPGNDIYVMDQAPAVARIDTLAAFSNVVYIAVYRNPVDQYVEITQAQKRSGHSTILTTERFWKGLERKYKKILDYHDQGNDILLVSFEDFVGKQAVRDKVACALSLDGSRYHGKYFKDTESAKNVGLCDQLDNAEKAYLEEKLHASKIYITLKQRALS